MTIIEETKKELIRETEARIRKLKDIGVRNDQYQAEEVFVRELKCALQPIDLIEATMRFEMRKVLRDNRSRMIIEGANPKTDEAFEALLFEDKEAFNTFTEDFLGNLIFMYKKEEKILVPLVTALGMVVGEHMRQHLDAKWSVDPLMKEDEKLYEGQYDMASIALTIQLPKDHVMVYPIFREIIESVNHMFEDGTTDSLALLLSEIDMLLYACVRERRKREAKALFPNEWEDFEVVLDGSSLLDYDLDGSMTGYVLRPLRHNQTMNE